MYGMFEWKTALEARDTYFMRCLEIIPLEIWQDKPFPPLSLVESCLHSRGITDLSHHWKGSPLS